METALVKKSNWTIRMRRQALFAALMMVLVLLVIFLYSCSSDDVTTEPTNQTKKTFYVEGTHLFDPCGKQVILKGVNKMSVFDENDPQGAGYFPEIAKSGANSVRIVWQKTNSNGTATSLTTLEAIIKNCMKEKMIPMVEMHEATCNLNGLNDLVNFWSSAPVVALVKKYEHAMLVNIANEAGDYSVTATQFETAYKSAITQLRTAGINTPLIIDAPDCGKNLELVVPIAANLVNHDPLHNILISAHPYWSKKDGATPQFIAGQLNAAATAQVPLILGEVCAFGGYPGDNVPETYGCTTEGAVDYAAVLTEAAKHDIGWLLWEWGPGNGYYNVDPVVLCPTMDITTNGTYASVQAITPNDPNAWAKDAVITGAYSIKNTALKTAYLQNGFICQ
ncbi:glycoside hydrolase family 5 protein [Chryseolinea soli]|nr:cellulase family glycosylhydrolase [Chryseolinea soli]